MLNKIKPYLISSLISLGIGGVAALLTSDSMKIFSEINKPSFAPPAWLFPVAWSILYVLMGIAAAMVWKANGERFDSALFFYGLQLVFNFFWSILFFNMQLYFISFLWLIILAVLIIFCIILFAGKSRKSALLLVPYLLWVCFAGVLNYFIWIMNP